MQYTARLCALLRDRIDDQGGGGGEAGAVSDDVLDGVGGGNGLVDDDRLHRHAVHERMYAEVEVGFCPGDGRTEVLVGIADVD